LIKNGGVTHNFESMPPKIILTQISEQKILRNEMIHSALSDFGFNDANLGMHSFRSGGATAAAQNDTPDRLFKIHCRWKSI
jgi:hypothetical protein